MDEKREKKEPEVENTEKQKRTRMRSPRTMMMETILELTEMAKSPDLKPTKKVDALLQKAALVTEAARLQQKDEESEALAENVTLMPRAIQGIESPSFFLEQS